MAQNSAGGPPRRPDVPGAAQYAGLGLTFGAGIVLFTLLGSWVDSRLGSAPWGLMLGVFGGFALSLFWVYRRLVVEPRERAGRGQGTGDRGQRDSTPASGPPADR